MFICESLTAAGEASLSTSRRRTVMVPKRPKRSMDDGVSRCLAMFGVNEQELVPVVSAVPQVRYARGGSGGAKAQGKRC